MLALAGCAGDSGRDRAVSDVVTQFYGALEAGDGPGACRLLAPAARDALERDAQAPCPEALLDEDLPPGSAARDTAVYGTAAQVRTATDTVFLGRFDGGWRVTAAGCTGAGDDAPYDCTVEGG